MHDNLALNHRPIRFKKDKFFRYASYAFFYAPIISIPILITIAIWQGVSSRDLPQCPESIPKENNYDMYGIGIRLATYLQLLIWCLAPILKDEKLGKSLSTVNNWFLIAFFAALISMLQDPEVQVIELYIVVLLGNGLTTMMIQLTEPLATSWYYSYDTLASVLFKMFIMHVWKGMTTWFWWRLIPERLAAQSADNCTQFGYFVVRMTFASGSKLHTLHKMLNVLGWCFWLMTHFRFSVFTCFIILRFIFWSLRPEGKRWYDFPWRLVEKCCTRGTERPRFISALSQHNDLPRKLEILNDCLFTFPMGDFKAIIYGRLGLPPRAEIRAMSGEVNPRLDLEELDGPEKDPSEMTPDIDIVDQRFVNYIVGRYNLPNHLYCDPPRSLTFFSFQALFSTSTEAEKHAIWESRRIPRTDCLNMFCLTVVTLIIPVEFTIAVNKIPGVNNFFQAGQLLALVVTIGALLAVAMRYLTGQRRETFGQPLYLPNIYSRSRV